MIRVFAGGFLCLFALLAAISSPLADEYDGKLLFRKGAWSVNLTHSVKNGNVWCNAETRNRSNQLFSLTAYETNTLRLFVFDDNWNIAKRPIRFLIDVDYSRWTVDGSGDGIGVSVLMDDPKTSVKFLREVMNGNAVAVMNSDERRLATFSLNGSSAAVNALFECWSAISTDPDPFKSDSDPFGASTDPFH